MATKHKRNKQIQQKSQFFESVRHYATSRRVHFVLGLLICFFAVYTGIAMISYFFTGAADQHIVDNLSASDVLLKKVPVSNWAGTRGAYIANIIIDHWFGISSFFLLFFVGSAGFRLMKFCRMNLFRRFLLCSVLTIWLSLLLASVFSFVNILFFHPGGLHGEYLSKWLVSNIGYVGLILLLLAGFILVAIFVNSRTIPVLQSLLFFDRPGKGKKRNPTGKGRGTPPVDGKTDDEEDEPEIDDDSETDDDYPEDDYIEPQKRNTPDNGTLKKPDTDKEEEFTVVSPPDEDDLYDGSELGTYDPRLDLSGYRFPDMSLLKKYEQPDKQVDMVEQNDNQKRIKKTLEDFGINIISIKATVGPTITLYEVVPDKGVRISKIRNLEDDIALSLSALGIRIIAPMPGKGTIGIEVPNKNPQTVSMESVVASRKFVESKYELPIVLGRTITNEVFMLDLTKMPHLLIAGATGQGKSVGLNVIITSLLYKKHPAELKFVLVDPKMVEFNIYEDIERHYLAKLPDQDKAIITDFNNVIDTLKSLCKEMDDRYDLLMKAHVRNISEYNEKFISRHLNPEKGHKFMPYIVVVIDEFGDLIMTAGKEIEMPIARIAQKARAVGIHMIIATQRPSTNIITGTIKANFPARVAFKVSSMIDSRTILDVPGANKLVGRGDLLFSQGNDTLRVQCALVSTDEIENIVKDISNQTGFETAYKLPEVLDENVVGNGNMVSLSDRDPLFDEAARLIVLQQQGSTSLIQRKFAIGYNRAGRLMDQLEKAGVVGSFDGNKGRQVLIMDESVLEQKLSMMQSN
ncbi:MAG: DNA translocase FtsK [Tannerella sp.]|jgi:S-DNA-T family DNA segregation ATPase FtsK/SpoIIIE|nr:DNA translocase FtsK [Tannerella sp.]